MCPVRWLRSSVFGVGKVQSNGSVVGCCSMLGRRCCRVKDNSGENELMVWVSSAGELHSN